MKTEVFIITHPGIGSDNLYYVCNTEWSWEINEAGSFRSQESAEMMFNRLQDKCQFRWEVESQGLNPDLLAIKSTELEVADHIEIAVMVASELLEKLGNHVESK